MTLMTTMNHFKAVTSCVIQYMNCLWWLSCNYVITDSRKLLRKGKRPLWMPSVYFQKAALLHKTMLILN